MATKQRIQNPPYYRNYTSYKKYLRQEFNHRCAYCDIHEAEDGGSNKFHVDHYLPKSVFPEKLCEYSNLFYSCSDCNKLKGNYWADWIQKFLHKYILNPCDYDYDLHFERTHSIWDTKSQAAKWNVEKLRLNSKKKIATREARVLFVKNIEELSEKKNQFELALTTHILTQSDIKEIEKEIEDLDRQINLYKFKVFHPLD